MKQIQLQGDGVADVALANMEFNAMVKLKLVVWFAAELDLWTSLRKKAFAYKRLAESSPIKVNFN